MGENIRSTIVTNSIVGGNVTNNANNVPAITADQWEKIMLLAAQNNQHGEVKQVMELQNLLSNGKTSEARSVWAKLKGFIDWTLPYAAQSAEIVAAIAAIDALTR